MERRLCLLVSTLSLAAACGDPGLPGSSGDERRAGGFVHARVRFPPGSLDSELFDEGSGLLWQIPEEELGEAGWWLVYLPAEKLDELAGREGIEWQPLPDGLSVARRTSADDDRQPFVIDGDPCSATPIGGAFCPYDTTVSATPGIVCNRSILAELDAASTDFPPVLIGGVSTPYVETVTLGTTSGTDGGGKPFRRPIKAVRVGKLRSSAPVPQLVVYAAQHAREWAGSEMIMRTYRSVASRFRAGDPAIRALLADRAILFIPVVNVDGYARNHQGTTDTFRLWRGNLENCGLLPVSGHDPNRNFPLTWGLSGASATCTASQDTTFRGPSPASGAETAALNAATATGSHRTLVALNTHTYGNLLLFAEGLSDGFSPCTTDSNCTAPDLGVFYRLAGTERAPRIRDEEDPSVPYMVGQTFRALYTVSGDSVNDAVYRLPAESRFLSLAVEVTNTECAFRAERIPEAQLGALAVNYRSFVESLASQLDELSSGAIAPSFDLPMLHRRHPSSGGLAEFPTLRLAARTSLAGVTITPASGGAGTTAADEVRTGVFYREWRYRSNDPYVFSTIYTVCARNSNCSTFEIDGATTLDLCDPSRYVPDAGWTFVPDDGAGPPREECFYHLTGSGSLPWQLTSTLRNLQHMDDARLVFSYRWDGLVRARVLVSDNGFTGCSATGAGCRIVQTFDATLGNRTDRRGTGDYRTEILDLDDFSLRKDIQVRFEVYGGTAPSSTSFQVFDPVFVGWHVP